MGNAKQKKRLKERRRQQAASTTATTASQEPESVVASEYAFSNEAGSTANQGDAGAEASNVSDGDFAYDPDRPSKPTKAMYRYWDESRAEQEHFAATVLSAHSQNEPARRTEDYWADTEREQPVESRSKSWAAIQSSTSASGQSRVPTSISRTNATTNTQPSKGREEDEGWEIVRY
ncbi:hypothetical protein IAU59_000658 [Kwoniella sp. CBS 9459]